jgi:hypothetical protein
LRLEELKQQAESLPTALQNKTSADPAAPALDPQGKKIPDRVMLEDIMSPSGDGQPTGGSKAGATTKGDAEDKAATLFKDGEEFSFVQSPKPRRMTGMPPRIAQHGVEDDEEDDAAKTDATADPEEAAIPPEQGTAIAS